MIPLFGDPLLSIDTKEINKYLGKVLATYKRIEVRFWPHSVEQRLMCGWKNLMSIDCDACNQKDREGLCFKHWSEYITAMQERQR